MPLVIDSKFRPFSFEELIRPLQMYKESYDKVEADYSNLAAQTEQWKDIANQTQSPEAYAMYSKYANDLNNIVEDFSRGMTMQNRGQLGVIRRRYASEIIPIAKAATRKRELEDEQRKLMLQDPTRIWQRNASEMSIDELLKNPSATYGQSYSGQALMAQSSTIAQNLARGMLDYGLGKPIDEYTNTFIQRYGLKPSDIQDYLAGKPTATSAMLQRIHDQVLHSSGINTWNNKEATAKATEFINQGIWSAIGQASVQAMENYGTRKALDFKMQKDLMDYQKSLETPTDPPIDDSSISPDPRDLFTPAEQSEVDTNLKQYSKYFYTKNGKTYLNNAGLREYNSMLPGYARSKDGTLYPTTSKTEHTGFYKFLNSIGAGKYIRGGKQVGPGRIGNLWNQYIKRGNKAGDAIRYEEYNYKIDPKDQENFWQSLTSDNKGDSFDVVEFGTEKGKPLFKGAGTVSKEALEKEKFVPTEIRGSGYDMTVIMSNKKRNIRIRMPKALQQRKQENAKSAFGSAAYFSEIAQRAKKALNVQSIDVALEALRSGTLYGKKLTEQQKEFIRQWADAERQYKEHVQNGYFFMSQLNAANSTKPTEYNVIGY